MVEIVARVAGYAEPMHDRPRPHVADRRERHDLIKLQLLEGERPGCAGRFSGVAAPPSLARVTPADLDRRREARCEARACEPGEIR
jgi:hypothetical protein